MADRRVVTLRGSALVGVPDGINLGGYTSSLIEQHVRQVERAVEVARHHRLSDSDVERLARLAEAEAIERSARMTAEEAALVIHEAASLGMVVSVEVAP